MLHVIFFDKFVLMRYVVLCLKYSEVMTNRKSILYKIMRDVYMKLQHLQIAELYINGLKLLKRTLEATLNC